MRYDKGKPCDVRNPLPQSKWPFKKWQKVLFLTKHNEIRPGMVTFYQPALEESCVVSKGHPCVTLRTRDAMTQVISLDNVRADNKSGRMDLALRMCENAREILEYHEAMVRHHTTYLASAKAMVEALRAKTPAPRRMRKR